MVGGVPMFAGKLGRPAPIAIASRRYPGSQAFMMKLPADTQRWRHINPARCGVCEPAYNYLQGLAGEDSWLQRWINFRFVGLPDQNCILLRPALLPDYARLCLNITWSTSVSDRLINWKVVLQELCLTTSCLCLASYHQGAAVGGLREVRD